MKKKELLLEVYSEPMIQELLEKGFLTKEQLVEFVLNEKDEDEDPPAEPSDEEEAADEVSAELSDEEKSEAVSWLGDAWDKLSGTAAEKIKQAAKYFAQRKQGSLAKWLSMENPLAIEKRLQQDLKTQRAKGTTDEPPSGAAKTYNLNTLKLTLNVSISLGRRVLKVINQIDKRIGWDDGTGGTIRREIPDSILNLEVPDGDATAQKAKDEKIKKYRSEIDRIENILAQVEPQVTYNKETDKVEKGINDKATIFDLAALLRKDSLEKLKPEQYQAVRETLGDAFIKKNASKGLDELKRKQQLPGEKWRSITKDALNGILKYYVNISKIEKQIKDAEEKTGSTAAPVKKGQGNAIEILSGIFGETLPSKALSEMTVNDFFPKWEST